LPTRFFFSKNHRTLTLSSLPISIHKLLILGIAKIVPPKGKFELRRFFCDLPEE
jgi:hypothetical protein